MIRLARRWYNFVADFHSTAAAAHSSRRDRALRKLEQLERRRRDRETQREIGDLMDRRDRELARQLRRPDLRVVSTDIH